MKSIDIVPWTSYKTCEVKYCEEFANLDSRICEHHYSGLDIEIAEMLYECYQFSDDILEIMTAEEVAIESIEKRECLTIVLNHLSN